MAELIDREAFLKRFTSEYRCKFTFGEAKILNVMFEELKKEATTTEAEIRAKAIDEFARKLLINFNDWQMSVAEVGNEKEYETIGEAIIGIEEIAERLKERD